MDGPVVRDHRSVYSLTHLIAALEEIRVRKERVPEDTRPPRTAPSVVQGHPLSPGTPRSLIRPHAVSEPSRGLTSGLGGVPAPSWEGRPAYRLGMAS
jgi:hypothetical protein